MGVTLDPDAGLTKTITVTLPQSSYIAVHTLKCCGNDIRDDSGP